MDIENGRSSSSRVTPIDNEELEAGAGGHVVNNNVEEQEQESDALVQERWLPITESRKGNSWKAAWHLISSGIGVQILLLPLPFISLHWVWTILCLSLAFSWQLYTKWLLVNLHETTPPSPIRYSRYLHLSIVAFGEKLGKILALFPTMYLSGGTCVMYIINGGTNMRLLYAALCGPDNTECRENNPTGAQWFLIFICLAILVALFFHNLNSLASISLIGSITALAYCTLLSALSIAKGKVTSHSPDNEATAAGFRHVMNGIGTIVFAFRGHNLVLEIQGTLPTDRKHPSRKPMWRGVTASYLLIAICMYPLAISGYWAYGDKIPASGGILAAFTAFHQNDTSKYIIGVIYLMIIISYICAFQIYAIPTFDNLERLYTSRKSKACPRWVQIAFRVFFGGLTYLIAVAFPFLPSLGSFIGSIALPLALVYPCLMWIAIRKPGLFSRMWWVNVGLGSLGTVLSVACGTAALWSLIVNGLDANFFNP